MTKLNELKIQNGEIFHKDRWNGLIEWVVENPLNLKDSSLTLSIPTKAKLKIETSATGTIDNPSAAFSVFDEITTDGFSKTLLSISNQAAYIRGPLQIQSPHGYLYVGPINAGFSHFETDRPLFYFNKEIQVDSGKIGSYNEELNLCIGGTSQMVIKANGHVGIGVNPTSKLEIKGELTIQSDGHTRAFMIIKNRNGFNNNPAKQRLTGLPPNTLIIGGAFHDKIYFYWNDNQGRKRKAIISGTIF